MDASRWRQLEQIVGDSLHEPAGSRAAFLETSAENSGFTHDEVLEVCAALLAVDLAQTPNWGAAAMPKEEQSDQPLVGIEAFELIEELGAGGMGVVYRARQSGAVEREVALKLCPAQPSAHLRQRLRQERRTLARLNHPNIAQMLEAGDSPTGQPYFVMELVSGAEPINSYCDNHRLGVRERLQLFLRVCAGVQYAHQQGVLHRDLKPANVLARGPAAATEVKIIDFGIAKLLQEEMGTDSETAAASEPAKTDLTGLAILGTPNYMSPERLRIGIAEIDSRSDIYSLGVMLYELLLGEPPCCRLVGEAIADYRDRRTGLALPTLDSQWQSMGNERQLQLAQARAVSQRELGRTTSSDLRWIVAKALADDPAERYPSASEMASDLQRHLDRRPVLAAPPSLRYQLGLLIRRRRWPVLAATLALSALLIAFWLRGLETERANAAAAKAQQSQSETERALRFLSNLFVAADPRENLGRPPDAAELLRRGAEQLANDEMEEAPLVRARLLHAIAEVQWRRGDPRTAVELASQALQLRTQVAPDDLELRADSLHLVGTLYSEVDQYPLAEQMLDEALRLRKAVHGEGSAKVFATLNNIGAIKEETGDFVGALATYQIMLDLLAARGTERELDYARTLSNQGVALRRLNRFDEAEAAHRQALEIHQRRLDPTHPNIALDWTNLGDLALARSRYEDALTAFREAETLYRNVVGDQHYDLARALNGIGNTYMSLGQSDLASEHFEQALAIYDRHGSSNAAYPLANLALVAHAAHDWPTLAQRSAAFLERYPDGHANAEQWAEMRCLYARQLSERSALNWIDEALQIIGVDGESLGDLSRARCLLAGVAVADRIGDVALAQRYVEAVTELAEERQLHSVAYELRLRQALLASASGDGARAQQLAQSLLRDWPPEMSADDGVVIEAQRLLAPGTEVETHTDAR